MTNFGNVFKADFQMRHSPSIIIAFDVCEGDCCIVYILLCIRFWTGTNLLQCHCSGIVNPSSTHFGSFPLLNQTQNIVSFTSFVEDLNKEVN